MNPQTKCAACGLVISSIPRKEIEEMPLCSECTLEGTIEPIFESIVYKTVLSYARNNKETQDERELLERAQQNVVQLPYWKNKKLPTTDLKQFMKAKQSLQLFSNIDHLEIDEQIFEPRDFFISHKWHKKCDEVLVEPLVKILKAYGYRIWYDKDTWDQEAGEKKEWMKRGIEQARHCVVILCKDYLSSEACRYELETMLSTKESKFIHPIWWTDITKEFLTQDRLTKKISTKKPIKWKKEAITDLINQLIEQTNAAEGIQTYNGVELRADEARLIKALETLVYESIPALKKNAPEATFGFYTDEKTKQILTLVLHGKGLKRLPYSLGQCLGLRLLNVSNNELEGLPESFGQLRNLEQLNVQGTRLQVLPSSFRTVHRHLMPQYPGVDEAEAEVLALLELLLGEHIPQKPQMDKIAALKLGTGVGALSFGYSVQNKHVSRLGLIWKKLAVLPKSIGNLKSLQTLNLANNDLISLPESIGNLKNLKELYLEDNKLASLPKTFESLKSLELIDLRNNQLKLLPESLKRFFKRRQTFL
ncbi:MAG: TIR domain-containing protein [Candidatus Hermodarchaeota archaeon]